MLFDRIEDRGAGLCAIFQMDMKTARDADGFVSFRWLTLDPREQAFNEESLVQRIANVEHGGHAAVQEHLALFELQKQKAAQDKGQSKCSLVPAKTTMLKTNSIKHETELQENNTSAVNAGVS